MPAFLVFSMSTCASSSCDEGIGPAVITCRNVSLTLKPKGRVPSGLLFTAFTVRCCLCLSVQLATNSLPTWLDASDEVYLNLHGKRESESQQRHKLVFRATALLETPPASDLMGFTWLSLC